jgi:DHA1 family bicyclomycin/chloramphenicol resistance-like MFS transporter
MAGTVVCRRWLASHGVRRAVARAGVLSLLSGLLLFGLAAAGVQAAWAVIVPQAIYIFAHAVHQSCGQAAVMAPFGSSAGTATALQGTLLPLVAVAMAAWLARQLTESALALPLGLGTCALLTAAVAWTWVQRAGSPEGGAAAPRLRPWGAREASLGEVVRGTNRP